jgi:hypothetical protein
MNTAMPTVSKWGSISIRFNVIFTDKKKIFFWAFGMVIALAKGVPILKMGFLVVKK